MKRVRFASCASIVLLAAIWASNGFAQTAPPAPIAPAPPLPTSQEAAAPEQATDDGAAKPWKRKRPEFVLGISGNRRTLFSIPFWAVGGEAGFSFRPSENFAFELLAEHMRGASDNGLPAYTTRVRFAPQVVVFQWLRIGGVVGPSYLTLERATTHSTINRVGLVVGGEAVFDVISGEDISMFLGVRGEFEFLWGNAVQGGGTASIGIRL
jgi:hypothetical protein